jgi:hypothetical protein
MVTKTGTAPISILMQTIDTLAQDAERLRMAHVWDREYNWSNPIAEDEATLYEAAEKVERFRLGLLRFTRQHLKSTRILVPSK